jgi:SAM-dependent methyltransferase
VLGHEVPTEEHRLHLLERALDPETTGILEQRGIEESWRCLELGAGAGSVARWLASRCESGHVVATDTDTPFLDPSRAPNLEVVRHDVVAEDFPPASFDLIHARWLLANLSEREEVLAKAACWLAPGGWLVIEEYAIFPSDSSPYPAFRRLMGAMERLLADSHGADNRWARRLPAPLAGAGLREVGMSVSMLYVGDGGPGEEWYRVMMAQAAPALTGTGLLSEAELEAGLAVLDDPSFVDMTLATVSAWGRRPPSEGG